MRATCRIKTNMADQNHELVSFLILQVERMRKFSYSGALVVCSPHTRIFFVTNDEKYQTCLIFGLHVTNDENAVNVARTRGNFVDPTCHE